MHGMSEHMPFRDGEISLLLAQADQVPFEHGLIRSSRNMPILELKLPYT